VANLADDLLKAGAHAAQGGQQLGDLVAACRIDAPGEVTGRHRLGQLDGPADRRRDRARQQQIRRNRRAHGQDAGRDQHVALQAEGGLGIGHQPARPLFGLSRS
jgi:hypothetical protein